MRDIVVATGNDHKLAEIVGSIGSWGFNCRSLKDFPQQFDYDEPYFSFIENALHKAREVSKIVSLPVLADDSGLCVSALDGAPGIFSARYSGFGTDFENRKKLLLEMQGVEDRSAFFVCVIVLIRSWNDSCPLVAYGIWNGSITLEEKGRGGFGYDSVFRPLGCDQTVAEMPPHEKSMLSHRAQALRIMEKEVLRWPIH